MKHKLLLTLTLFFTILNAQVWLPGDHNSWALDETSEMTLKSGLGGDSYYGITITTPTQGNQFKIVYNSWDHTWASGYWIPGSESTDKSWIIPWSGDNMHLDGDNYVSLKSYLHISVHDPSLHLNTNIPLGMQTLSASPANILTVSQIGTSGGDGNYVTGNESDTVFITTDKVLSPEEKLYVRYGVNGFETDGFIQAVSAGGTDYYAILPNGAGRGDTTHYYALTSTLDYAPGGDLDNYTDLLTLAWNTNSGANWQVISDVNQPPVIQTAIEDQTLEAGETLTLNLTATDADGDSLSWQALDKPEGATLTDNGDGTAVFAWTPESSDTGTHTITLVVTDATAQSQSLTVDLKEE
jgi:hypothetical protein